MNVAKTFMSRVGVFFFTGILLTISAGRPAAAEVAWTGKGPARILVEVPPRDLGGRAADEMPARVKLDLAEVLKKGGFPGTPDLGRIQVIRYDPVSGKPIPSGTFRGAGPDDLPYRFDDFDRREHTFWYNVPGNGRAGDLVWTHRQEGGAASHYAIYVDVVPDGNRPGESPVPLLGDSDALWTDESEGFLITALHCKPTMCDWNGDGLQDLIVGEIQGHLFYFENRGTRGKPAFAGGQFLMLGDKPLRLTHYTTPKAVDWDDDGDLDLIVGRANGGQVLFIENVGTPTRPELALRGRIEADGKPISIPHQLTPGENIFHQEYMCMPEVVDWDGDGDKDLLVGGYITGAVFYFENTRNRLGIPELRERPPLEADGKTLCVRSAASPCVADFDGDGDLDMITAQGDVVHHGQFDEAGIVYFENDGTPTEPKLTARPFPFVDEHNVGIVAVPDAADWDGDGDLDLVIGSMHEVWLYRNEGDRKSPKFAKAEPLRNRWGPVRTGAFATSPVDWDGDGDIDLISSFGGRFELKRNMDPRNPPRWKNEGFLKAAGEEIRYVFELGDPETFPVAADLDRDGRIDLLQGVAAGYVWFYRNVGTREKPELAEGFRLKTEDGGFVKVGRYQPGDKAVDFASHSGDRSDPKPADFDGDGDLDLLVSDAYGKVTYFENVGGNENPLFAKGVEIIPENGQRALIGVTDWDADGRPDMLFAQGNVRLFKNTGEGKTPMFEVVRDIPHQYIPYPHPYAVDWNGDGDTDLFVSSSYSVAYLIERSYIEGGYAEGRVIGVQAKGER